MQPGSRASNVARKTEPSLAERKIRNPMSDVRKKSETRIPKADLRPKVFVELLCMVPLVFEGADKASPIISKAPSRGAIRTSVFGIASAFDLRISDFISVPLLSPLRQLPQLAPAALCHRVQLSAERIHNKPG